MKIINLIYFSGGFAVLYAVSLINNHPGMKNVPPLVTVSMTGRPTESHRERLLHMIKQNKHYLNEKTDIIGSIPNAYRKLYLQSSITDRLGLPSHIKSTLNPHSPRQ